MGSTEKDTFRKQFRKTLTRKQIVMGAECESIVIEEFKKFLEAERDTYAEDTTYPLGQRVLIGTYVSELIRKLSL